MAYKLPPPVKHEDPNVRAWLFEVYKRNQSLLDDEASIALSGEVTAPATTSVDKAFVVPATINMPFLTAIDGGGPASTYTSGAPNPVGAYSGVFARAADVVTLTTSVIASTNFTTGPSNIATDGAGNWILTCANGWSYRSTDMTTWTGPTAIGSTVHPSSIATDGAGTWVAIGGGLQSIFRTIDNGVSWSEITDSASNRNGVNRVFWSPSASKFFTNGTSQILYSADGTDDPWTDVANGFMQFPKGYIITDSNNYAYGYQSAGAPRNGTDPTLLSWSMDNDLPNTGDSNGVPNGPGDYDGTTFCIAANLAQDYRYWTSGSFSGWNSSPNLRYDDAKTDAIAILKYLDVASRWLLITDIGDVYYSDDPASGETSWTIDATGLMPGEIPKNDYAHAEGPDGFIYLNDSNELIVTKYS